MSDLSYVYIVMCNDNNFYTGWTVNLYKRIIRHNEGKASKYTRGRLPVKLVYFEVFNNKIDAQRREYTIKQLSRKQKLKLIQSL